MFVGGVHFDKTMDFSFVLPCFEQNRLILKFHFAINFFKFPIAAKTLPFAVDCSLSQKRHVTILLISTG